MIKLPSISDLIHSMTDDERQQVMTQKKIALDENLGDDGTVDCLSCLLMDLDFIPYAHADIAYSLIQGK